MENKIAVKKITRTMCGGLIGMSGEVKTTMGTGRNTFIGFVMAGIMFLAGGDARGQIEIGLAIEPAQALIYEPVQARVVIHNNTGGILAFDAGKESPRFSFGIEHNRNEGIKQTDRVPLLFGVKLVPGEVATNSFALTSLYALQARGIYKVRACLEWNNVLFTSPIVELDLLRGFEIARVISGVPGKQGALRIYVLEYLPKDGGEYAYLRIEDEQAKTVYGTHNLGYIVRVRKPEMKVDEAGNIHVLFQSMSMVFVHTAFTPYGVQLFSKDYSNRSMRVNLVNLPNGRVSVSSSKQEKLDGSPSTLPESPLNPETESPSKPDLPDLPPIKARGGRGGLFGPKAP